MGAGNPSLALTLVGKYFTPQGLSSPTAYICLKTDIYFDVYGCFACKHVCSAHRGQRGIESSVPGAMAATRVLGTKPGSSATAASILTRRSSCQPPTCLYYLLKLIL